MLKATRDKNIDLIDTYKASYVLKLLGVSKKKIRDAIGDDDVDQYKASAVLCAVACQAISAEHGAGLSECGGTPTSVMHLTVGDKIKVYYPADGVIAPKNELGFVVQIMSIKRPSYLQGPWFTIRVKPAKGKTQAYSVSGYTQFQVVK